MTPTPSHGNGNGRFRVPWLTVLGWVVGAMLAYGAVEARVRVLEFQYSRVADDIRDIKVDVKDLLRWSRGTP